MSLQSDVMTWIKEMNTPAKRRVYDLQVPEDVPYPFLSTALVQQVDSNVLSGKKLFTRTRMRCAIFAELSSDRDAVISILKRTVEQFRLENPKGGFIGSSNIMGMRAEITDAEANYLIGDQTIKGTTLDLVITHKE